MKIVLSLFLFILLFLSCSTEKVDFVAGEFKSTKPSMFKTFFSNSSYVLGNTLMLNKDSTYHMSTCAMIIEGRWFVRKDTLFLKQESKKFILDSLNNQKWEKHLHISVKPNYYLISKNHLIKTFKNDDGSITIDQQTRAPD